MLEYIKRLLIDDGLSSHGICLLWRSDLMWTHGVSDALIGISYLSISCFLAYLLSRRPDIKFAWVVWYFAIFIFACGATHLFAVYTLWVPDYGVEAILKIVTAAASVVTAIVLWPLLPRALAWPSPEQLADSNAALAASLAERDAVLAKLQDENAERARLETMLRQSQKMEALGQLTGGLAHDYNNILAIITMNLARVEKRLAADASTDIKRALAHAGEAADRAAGITERMLSFSRQTAIARAPADIRSIVDSMLPLLQDAVGSRRSLAVDLPEGLPLVEIDINQFENALLNLVLNARDATPEDGTIRISALHDAVAGHPVVVLDVSDTGTGMPPEVIDRAFDPFFTTKPIGKGTGLGLSQVFGFVKRFGGSISITSEVGAGTSVRMQLPVGA